MFTGIIQNLGKVRSAEASGTSLRLQIETGFPDLELGESIAVNGVCLTVSEQMADTAFFFVSPETLFRSNLGNLKTGFTVNVERALAATGRFSGHLVQGHVDGQAQLLSVSGDLTSSYEVYFRLSETLARYCVEKGSIALNGVSLTINSIHENPDGPGVTLGIVLVPHTWTHTNFPSLTSSDLVNVEIDILAKYVERLCQPFRKH